MVRKCTQCLMLRSPSFVSLYARHLLPFGRRLLWSCSWQAKKVCCCIGTAYRSLLLKEKVGGFSRSDEARNPPLWQIKAYAAPMRQRVLLALASQNDYAEL